MTERNPYLGLEDDADALRASRLAGSLSTAVASNPDQVSAQRRTATYLGYPLAAVEALPKETGLQAAVKRVTDATANSPALQNKYLDPEFAKLAHDDAGKLSEIEQAVRKYGELKAWKGPEPTTGSVLRGLAESLPQGFRAAREGLRQQMGDLFDALGILPRTEAEKAEQLRRTARAQGASDFTTPEFESSTAKGIYGGLASTLRQAPGIALSVVTGNPTPVLASIGVQTQAEAYGKYRARGATPGQAFVGGTAEGAVEVGTELLPMGFLVNKLGKVGMTEFFTGMLARELPSEQVATLLQDAIDTAIANPDKTWADYLNERPEAAYQTLVATITQSAVMGGVSAAARRALRDTNQINDAETDAQRIGALFAKAGESKLRERDPQAFAELVQGVADQTEGAPKSVFIDAATLAETLQQSGLNEAQLEEVLPGVAAQLPEAMAAGGTVELPIGDLVARVTGTPLEQALLPNLRTTPDALSQAEAQDAADQAETYLQQQAERVIAEATNADAMRASAEVVKANVLDQLNATKRFRPDVNEAYATLARAFYTTMAGRTGVTPEEMFARYPLRIVSEQADGGVLDSAAGKLSPQSRDLVSRLAAVARNSGAGVGAGQSVSAQPQVDGTAGNAEGLADLSVGDAAVAQERRLGREPALVAVLTEMRRAVLDDPKVLRAIVGAVPVDVVNNLAGSKRAAERLLGDHPMFKDGSTFDAEMAVAGVLGDTSDPVLLLVRQVARMATEGGGAAPSAGGEAQKGGAATGANEGRGFGQDAAPRATFSPSRLEISLLPDADLTSFLHEMGHFFLEVQADLASQLGAPQQIVDDFNTVLKWFGIKGDEDGKTPSQVWASLDLEGKRPYHERWAESWEQYLFEGKAPSVEMRGVFQRFREFMISAYKSLKNFLRMRSGTVGGQAGAFAQPAYHGTPYRGIEKFDTSKIGTGEGAQAYGWGLYFAGRKEIAEWYREKLSKPRKKDPVSLDGKTLTPAAMRKAGERYRKLEDQKLTNTPEYAEAVITAKWLDQFTSFKDARAAIARQRELEAEGKNSAGGVFPVNTAYWDNLLAWMDANKSRVDFPARGQLYEVDIPEDSEMLLWDKPLSEQPAKVREVLGEWADRAKLITPYKDVNGGTRYRAILPGETRFFKTEQEARDAVLSKWDGGSAYMRLAEQSDQRAASEALAALGIKGIKYLDGTSRAAGDGSYNYVIFSGDDVAIRDTFYQSAPRDQTETPEFKAWFGDSKVVDAEGKPLVVYHGTASDFAAFVPSKATDKEGRKLRMGWGSKKFYFTTEPSAASSAAEWAAQSRDRPGSAPNVMPVYLNVRNPIAAQAYTDMVREYEGGGKSRDEAITATDRRLKARGVDGIVDPETGGIAVFSPEQIKSAIGNDGTFDANDPSILSQGRTPGNPLGLSDEVRGVFDRLIATDEQIAEAQSLANFEAVFKSAEQAGMTPEEWAAYQAQNAAATAEATETLQKKSLADMKWVAAARGKALRKAQAEVKDKRDAMRAEVTAEVEALPIEQARAYLRTERKGGAEIDLDTVAEQFGFTSGDELARTMAEQPGKADLIEALTEQRLLETYGEVVTADGMARAANEAVHNEARRRFVATELAAMQRAMSATAPTGKTDKKGRPLGVNVIVQAAKAFAETVVNRRKILDLKPAQHAAAATRAAAKAAKLTAEGKTAEAIGAKRDQLLSEYTARYTEQARQEVLKGLEYLKKFDKASVREKLPADYVDQIDQMLERFEFKTSTTARELDRRASLAAWVASQQEMGLDPVVPQDLLDNARLTSYKQMTVEEFRGLVDGVKSIEHLARLKSKLLAAKDKREFDAIADEIAASIVEHGGTPRPVQLEPDGRIKKFFKGAWADHRKLNSLIRQMDGGKDNGPFYRALVRSMNDAGAREATMIEQATEALAKIYAPIEKLPGGFSGAKVYIDEIKNSLSRAGRLAVALNWGNPQNRQRVMDGDGWTEAQVNAILRTLTPVELKFVNDVWAHIDSYWPEIKAKQERVTGVAEEKVDAVPFDITLADGSTVQMRGGYYPIKYDADRSIKAEKQEALETAKEIMRGAVARPTTRRGHTKARVDEVKGRPVRKDLSVITQHVNQVVHDLAWHEWFIDANRLLNDKRIAGAIRQYHGNDAARVLKEAADAIAVGDAVHQGQIDRLLLAMRSNVSRSVMGASLTTALLQPFGLTQSMARVGVVPVLKGAARWAGDAARMESTVGWINEKSEFMRLRGKTFNRELREISQRVQGKSKFMQVYDASLFMLMQKLQLVADVPTWVGAYEKALAGGVDESAAVALADEAVLSSQGGGTTKDLAAVQRNMPFLTQFYSYFNTTLNLVAEKTATTDFKDPKAAAGWMADMALLTVIPAILPAMLTFLLKGGGDEDDDAEKWAKRILEWQAGYLFGMFVGLRELPTLWSPFDYAGPPAAKVLSDGKKVVQQAGQGEIDDPAIIASINLLGSVFGLPTVQVTRSYKGWKAWSEGDAPASSILFGPPPKEN